VQKNEMEMLDDLLDYPILDDENDLMKEKMKNDLEMNYLKVFGNNRDDDDVVQFEKQMVEVVVVKYVEIL